VKAKFTLRLAAGGHVDLFADKDGCWLTINYEENDAVVLLNAEELRRLKVLIEAILQ